MSILLHIFKKVLNADRAVPSDLYCNPFLYNLDRNFNTSLIEGRMGLIPLLQNANHFEMYVLYCLFVEFLHDLRMRSLACLGIPLSLSVFLICENTQGSSSLMDVVSLSCAEGTISVEYLEGGKIVRPKGVTGWATNFVWATAGQLVLLRNCPLLLSAEFLITS